MNWFNKTPTVDKELTILFEDKQTLELSIMDNTKQLELVNEKIKYYQNKQTPKEAVSNTVSFQSDGLEEAR